MSDDGYADCFEEATVEIRIKTLLGTAFDIKVASTDTIVDVKKAICRVEGIPVYQQNLIYRSEELKNTARICDLGIAAGTTLTLVSSMRGGPISTRRLSMITSCEHYFLKELKDLLDHTREGMVPGSKVSVLVFKEGDIINLLRVIENEDGSYSPYNDGPISPPSKPSRKNTMEVFERFVEDTEMCAKIADLRKKMEELNVRKRTRNATGGERESARERCDFSYRLLEECAEELLDAADSTVYEKNLDEGNQSESEEIALKDKHRTKPRGLQSVPVPKSNPKSLYNSRRGTYSCTRQNYAKVAKRREPRLFEKTEKNPGGCMSYSRERTPDDSFGNKNFFEIPNLNGKEPAVARNPYLLGGLNSNKLPDLRILDTDDFLDEPEPAMPNPPDTFLPLSDNVGGPANPRLLPDLTGALSQSAFGPIVPDILNSSEGRTRPLPFGSGYSLPSLTGATTNCNRIGRDQNTFANLEYSLSNGGGPADAPISLPRGVPRSREESPVLGAVGGASVEGMGAKLAEQLHLLDEEPADPCRGSRNHHQRVHLTRLVLSADGSERPTKRSPTDGLELEERHAQDVWEIHESATERLKHSATCKVGLLKRRQNVEYANYDGLDHPRTNLKPELRGNLGGGGGGGVGGGGDFASDPSGGALGGGGGVCSGSANYFVPYLGSAPSAIPPEYAPKRHPRYCDLFFGGDADPPRSPLYSRRNRKENLEVSDETIAKCSKTTGANLESDCSSIQRLRNDENVLGFGDEFTAEDLFGYYNLGCAADLSEREEEGNDTGTKCSRESITLPPVIKKKSRCNECNKRLNITNIYNCRCGRIFCSQHRYSEVHRCTYDYKTEGRKILERQNPLVTADKIQRF